MMVYGLEGNISNTEKLFNLVCLYGNVARVSADICQKQKFAQGTGH